MKQCIIYETFNSASSLDSRKGKDGLMRLSGVFGVCGVKNNNGRVYEHSNYSKMIQEMQGRIDTVGCPGELEHPNSMNITLENVSHKIESINIDEQGVVTGTIVVLDTPKGQIAQKIIEGGLPLFISSRAVGNVNNQGGVVLEELKTYDLVGTPGFSQAQLGLAENQTFESINESCGMIILNEEIEEPVVESIENKHINLDKIMEANKDNNFKTLQARIDEQNDVIDTLMETIEELKSEIITQECVNEGDIKDMITDLFETAYTPAIEEWVKNEVIIPLTESVEEWVVNEYSPEVQNWVVEQYSPEIQNWVVKEYTPTIAESIEKWIVEEYEGAGSEAHKANNLNKIDDILTMLEQKQDAKPVLNQTKVGSEFGGQEFFESMPDHIIPRWDMASKMVKEAISTRAKLHKFDSSMAINEFWNNVSFNEPNYRSIVENKVEYNDKEKMIREQLRAIGTRMGLK